MVLNESEDPELTGLLRSLYKDSRHLTRNALIIQLREASCSWIFDIDMI